MICRINTKSFWLHDWGPWQDKGRRHFTDVSAVLHLSEHFKSSDSDVGGIILQRECSRCGLLQHKKC